ncbi:hypothetical protein JTB14_005259 [Gonioctena quinquepunctata]|nr:hypothetical protein JTB14_005259 [Gonioctena quinquepunctata]
MTHQTNISQHIKIAQWNIRSASANYDELKIIIDEERPDIIMLNETFLQPNKKFNIKHYTIIREDRHDGYGGLAIAINTSVPFQKMQIQLNIPRRFQIQGIKVGNMQVITAYCPPDFHCH